MTREEIVKIRHALVIGWATAKVELEIAEKDGDEFLAGCYKPEYEAMCEAIKITNKALGYPEETGL